jgi:hypothetical protein
MRDHARHLKVAQAAPKGEFSAYAFLDNDGVNLTRRFRSASWCDLMPHRRLCECRGSIGLPYEAAMAQWPRPVALKYLISPDEL